MRHAAITFALTVGLLSCGAAAVEEIEPLPEEETPMTSEQTGTPEPTEVSEMAESEQAKVVSLDQPVPLAVGEEVALGDSQVTMGFEGVKGDSRCPRDVQCVWAGDATVAVWLQEGAGERQQLELHTTVEPKEGSFGGFRVRLERLDPYPESTGSISAEDYRAILRVTR